MSEAIYPVWPSESWPTREAGIVAAVALSEPGDYVIGHQPACATRRDEDCDCVPLVVIVNEGRA